MRELVDYMIGAESRFEKTTHVLDLFGASQKVAQTWASAGYKGISYDIKLSPAHDVTSRSGFYNLLDLALQLTDTALVVAAPPCSLMSSASQSVHKRSVSNPEGDQVRFKVRLSQRIWKSF